MLPPAGQHEEGIQETDSQQSYGIKIMFLYKIKTNTPEKV